MKKQKIEDSVLSPFCRSYYDKDKEKLVYTNSLERIFCCMETCKNHINFCFKNCDQSPYHDQKKCFEKCNEVVKICESSCMAIPSLGLRNVINCGNDVGCGSRPPFSTKCIKQNKDNIINCCKNKCLMSSDIDCENNDSCDIFYSFFSGETPFPIKYKNKQDNKDVKDNKDKQCDKNDNKLLYFVCILSLLSLFVFFLLLLSN